MRRLGEPSLRSCQTRTYALRAVRRAPMNRLLLVHTPACPDICGHTLSMFRVISGAFRDADRGSEVRGPAGLVRFVRGAWAQCADHGVEALGGEAVEDVVGRHRGSAPVRGHLCDDASELDRVRGGEFAE